MGEHKSDVLRNIVTIARNADGYARKKDNNLKYQAVETLRKLEPKALQAAFPTLADFTYTVYMPFQSKPAIHDDILYFYTREDRALVALDLQTWAEVWRNEKAPEGLPRYHNGTVFCGGAACDAKTGKIQWVYDGDEQLNFTPVAAHNETVYFAPQNTNKAFALDAETGREQWDCTLCEQPLQSMAPLIRSGTLYLCGYGDNHKVIAVDAQKGTVKWSYDFKKSHNNRPYVLFQNDKIWSEANGGITCLQAENGKEVGTNERITRTPLIAGDTLYGFTDRYLKKPERRMTSPSITALDISTGKIKWRTSLGDIHENLKDVIQQTPPLAVPPVQMDNRICFLLTNPDEIICLNRETGEFLWRYEGPEKHWIPTNPMTAHNSRLYLAPSYRIIEVDMETGKEVTYAPPEVMQEATSPKQEKPDLSKNIQSSTSESSEKEQSDRTTTSSKRSQTAKKRPKQIRSI